jgi:sugar phosphate isomerase/epimerase
VDVMVETHDGVVTPDAIRRFCAEAGGAAMLWDAHNTWRKTGIDPCVVWSAIAENVVHIHVKDSVDRPSASLPYSFVLPGTGEFPMRPLVEALRRDGYEKAVSLEWERQWHPDLPPLEEALQSAADCGWW